MQHNAAERSQGLLGPAQDRAVLTSFPFTAAFVGRNTVRFKVGVFFCYLWVFFFFLICCSASKHLLKKQVELKKKMANESQFLANEQLQLTQ